MSTSIRESHRGRHKKKGPGKNVPTSRAPGNQALMQNAGKVHFNASNKTPNTDSFKATNTAPSNGNLCRENGKAFSDKPSEQRTVDGGSLLCGADNSSVLDRSVSRSGLSFDSFVRALLGTALSRLLIWDQADLDRLLLQAERLGLDPLSGEIYALDSGTNFSDDLGESAGRGTINSTAKITNTSQNKKFSTTIEQSRLQGRKGVALVVSVDGWSRIINAHPQFDGMKFLESEPGHDELPLYFECTIFRKDRRVATSVREYMYEAHTGSGAWLTHPRRMLRHKAMVQCARICFGLGGVYEPDEAQRVVRALSERKSTSNRYTIGIAPDSPKNIEVTGQGHDRPKVNFSGSKSGQFGTGFVKDWVKRQSR